ncbi:MAG: twin-arginine translocase TatA/TatE family subunit [Anaerolineae bacterium]
MPFRVGPAELILVLLIALLIFGPGRIAKLGGELGKSIRAFQDGVKSNDGEGEEQEEEPSGES